MTLTPTAWRVDADRQDPIRVELDTDCTGEPLVRVDVIAPIHLVSGEHVRDFCQAVIRTAEAAGFTVPPVD